jgi:hypothetical protein
MIDLERLARITAVCRTETLHIRSERSCISSVRILTEVLDYFGHSSEPLPCTTMVFNAKGYELAEQGVPVDQWPPEAHSVGALGSGRLKPEVNGWDGHLVALVEDHWLVDPSLDQFSRPERGITTVPVVLDVTMWTDRSRACQWGRPDGQVLVYQVMPSPGPWRESPDWCGRENLKLFRSAIAASIRTLKQEAVA